MKENINNRTSNNSDMYLNLKEACDFLKISKSCLYKLTSMNKIKYYKPGGKLNYFKKSDLIEWLSTQEIKTKKQILEEANNYINNPFQQKNNR